MTTRLTATTALAPDRAWGDDIRDELQRNRENGRVGHELLSETDAVRIWRIALRPGERIGFHRHQLDYFWVAVTGGSSLSRHATGVTRHTRYAPGYVRHLRFAHGEFMLHDLTNCGDIELLFTTVEFKASANPPLPI